MATIWVKVKKTGEIGYTYDTLWHEKKMFRVMFPERNFLENINPGVFSYDFMNAGQLVQFPEDVGRIFDAAYEGVKKSQKALQQSEYVFRMARNTFQGGV